MNLRRIARGLLAATAVLGLVTMSACAGGDAADQIDRDVVRWAQFPGVSPNWILPITDPGHNATPNTMQFSYLMWRPLYWTGTGSRPTINQDLSIAEEPEFSRNNTRVSVTLKDYEWSDGEPVSSRDVEFWLNLIEHNTDRWSGYLEGNLPDNIENFEAVDDRTFVLTLTDPVSPEWFTNNQLTSIVPLPHHAWAKTTMDGQVGDRDRTAKGSVAIMDFLFEQSRKPAEYDSNQLWKTVNGPWTLDRYETDGRITFVPNEAYSGSEKPTIERFEQVPFTTEKAAFNALVAGDVDYGYLPFNNLNQRSRIEQSGYRFSSWRTWGFNYVMLNYNHPDSGPLVSQLYIRQALQSLVNQDLIIEKIFHGQGTPTYGPVPADPPNPYVTVTEEVYPYDPDNAVRLLEDHGWDVQPGGSTTCVRPGTGEDQCGAGIEAGEPLRMSALVTSDRRPVLLGMQAIASELSERAGVEFEVRPTPYAQILNDSFAACTKANPDPCPWQAAIWGSGMTLNPYPTGETIFHSTGASNGGHYQDDHADQLVRETLTGDESALGEYERYIAEQLPALWFPAPIYQLSMIHQDLRGAAEQNPYTALTPELWRWKEAGQ